MIIYLFFMLFNLIFFVWFNRLLLKRSHEPLSLATILLMTLTSYGIWLIFIALLLWEYLDAKVTGREFGS